LASVSDSNGLGPLALALDGKGYVDPDGNAGHYCTTDL
jgi:hypothetical protein